YDLEKLHPDLPGTINLFLNYWEDFYPMALRAETMIRDGKTDRNRGTDVNEADILAPVPFPNSCRDGYAFRQHVETARKNRGVEMISEFDQYPVFYFTNHHSIQGGGK